MIAASQNQSSKKYAWVHTDMICNPHADRVYASMDEQNKHIVLTIIYLRFPNKCQMHLKINLGMNIQ